MQTQSSQTSRGNTMDLLLLIGLLPLISGVLGNCPLVQAPQWGRVRERVLKDGTLQTVYSCEPGRRLKGHKILTCTADGWNHPIPKCVPHGKLPPPRFIYVRSLTRLQL
ncbi:hypothetical protein QLX08_001465 [Tetragonisca angustula]|uniref:Sushi domain-containing protein n=1 Tax=Tetragonisca angustula TaxID=166442 RepID=A0AAW1AFR2_9HYME